MLSTRNLFLVPAPGYTFNNINGPRSCSLSAGQTGRVTLQRYQQNYLSPSLLLSCPRVRILVFLTRDFLADRDFMFVTLHCPLELSLSGMLCDQGIGLMACCVRGLSLFVMGIGPNRRTILVTRQEQKLSLSKLKLQSWYQCFPSMVSNEPSECTSSLYSHRSWRSSAKEPDECPSSLYSHWSQRSSASEHAQHSTHCPAVLEAARLS